MECNRDEAIRVISIAEEKFATQDYAGAKRLVAKAQNMYPSLDGAPQMLAVVDVHIAAQAKVGVDETDWYGILQVEPRSDDETIKKQYKKLALMVHPDKNKSMGAVAAFNLISDAIEVLSNKEMRSLHDSKRGGEANVPQMTSQIPEPPIHSYSPYQNQAAARAAAGPVTQAPHAQAPQASLMFWTSCPTCEAPYQYLRSHLNCQVICVICQTGFLAMDNTAQPANTGTSFAWPGQPASGATSFAWPGEPASGATSFAWPGQPASGATSFAWLGQPASGATSFAWPGQLSRGATSFAGLGQPVSGATSFAWPGQPASGATSFAWPSQPVSGTTSFAWPGQPASGATSFVWPSQPASGSTSFAWPGQPASGAISFAWQSQHASGAASFAWQSQPASGATSFVWPGQPASGATPYSWVSERLHRSRVSR